MVQATIRVDLLVGRYSAEPYVRVTRGWNCDRQNQGRYDYCLLWDANPQSVNTGPGLSRCLGEQAICQRCGLKTLGLRTMLDLEAGKFYERWERLAGSDAHSEELKESLRYTTFG